jgi:hypothetical protein
MFTSRIRTVASGGALALLLISCSDSTSPSGPAVSVRIVSGEAQTGAAGQKLATPPRFVVEDAKGGAVANARFSVSVTAANGSITEVPAKTSAGPTSVGSWTLGPRVGVDSLTISVDGLAPIIVTATATAGPAATITTSSPTTFSARVAESAATAPHIRVTDAFGNPLVATTIHLSLTGGGSVSPTITTNANGEADVTDWAFSTRSGPNVLTLSAGGATLSFTANLAASDPVQIVSVEGDGQSAFAGSTLSTVRARITDRYGNGVAGQPISFAVTGGSGSLASADGQAGADGIVAVPAWTLGKMALPQTVRLTSGTLTLDVGATVKTEYHIDVRFFGPEMSDDQKALFTNAAARISAIITGHLPDMTLNNLSMSDACGLPGLPTLNETVQDLVIYASVQDIDGAGRILAQSGPCVTRPRSSGGLTSLGLMLFDAADLASMSQRGILQDVITHEMLHIVGIGTLWSDKQLVAAQGTPAVAYYGALGRQGCTDDGGTSVCANAVPVENNGVPGTADAHWRESTFGNELMTGYVNLNGMPLSSITVGSLADLGYVVNPLAADPYRVPSGALGNIIPTPPSEPWERRIRPISPP